MKLELIDHMGDDLRVANVARVSFAKWKEEIDVKDVKLIDYLAANEHNSPFRHTAITLRCEAPIFLARQLGKHQVGMSWNEVSRRYVDSDITFYTPSEWRQRPDKSIKQGSGETYDEASEKTINKAYSKFLKECQDFYQDLLDINVAPELARMVLPQAMNTMWIWTGSLEAFYHVWRLRSGEGSQEEAKQFAKALENVVEPLFPHCWKSLTRGVYD